MRNFCLLKPSRNAPKSIFEGGGPSVLQNGYNDGRQDNNDNNDGCPSFGKHHSLPSRNRLEETIAEIRCGATFLLPPQAV
jgi:hypothetical protein